MQQSHVIFLLLAVLQTLVTERFVTPAHTITNVTKCDKYGALPACFASIVLSPRGDKTCRTGSIAARFVTPSPALL